MFFSRLARAAYIALVGITLYCGIAQAEARPFEVAELGSSASLAPFLGYFEDAPGALTLEQVQQRAFASLAGKEPAFGFTQSAIWLRWRGHNRGPARRWLLELGYPHLDHVALHVVHADGSVTSREAGDFLPFAQRDVDDPSFVFALDTAADTTDTYFMRLQTSGSARAPLRAWSERAFHAEAARRTMILALFCGALIVMALFNLGVFTLIRQREYLYYVLLLTAILVAQTSLSGHVFQYVLPEHPLLANRLIGVSLAFVLLTIPLFAYAVVERFGIERELLTYKWAIRAGWLPVLFAAFGPLRFALRGVLVLMAFACVLAVPHLRALKRYDNEQGRLYILSWYVVIYAIPVFVLRLMQVIPAFPLSEWIVHIATTISAVITTLALASRVNVMVAELKTALSHAEVSGEEARRANRVKDDFMATMSHELRTPLNAIINVPQGLIDEFGELRGARCEQCQASYALDAGEQLEPGMSCSACNGALRAANLLEYRGDPEVTIRYLRKVERAGEHLLSMVNGVLDVSKLQAGRLELNLAEASLDVIIRESVDQLSELAAQKDLQLKVELPAARATSQLDALRVKQVLLNLLSNAFKFCEPGKLVTLSWERLDDVDLISVRDQGIGIAPEHHERIFVGFEQVHTGETRKYGGTGLGLSISRSLVGMHGGELWVESELGQGSVFRFSLPRVRSTVPVEPSNAA